MAMKVVPGSAPMSAVAVEDDARRWTPLAMKRALVAANKWAEVMAMLQEADKLLDFVMATYIAEGDADFQQARDWANAQYGKEAVDALLDQIPTEG